MISIITPTYNRADVIINNMNSIISKGYNDIEHIIVDNCSTDTTEKIISEYQKKINYNVIHICEPDKGIYDAMNKGISCAKGEWIHILNSDDYYSDFDFSKICNDLCSEDINVAVFPIIQIRNENSKIWVPGYNKDIKHYTFPHPGMIVKKSFYEEAGLYNDKYRIISDALWIIKNIPKSKYKIFEEPLVVMIDGGISNSDSFINIWEPFICDIFYQKFPLYFKLDKCKHHFKKIIKYLLNRLKIMKVNY